MTNLSHVILSDPDNKYEPYDTTNPLPVQMTGGSDTTAANQTTMINSLSSIDSAVTGTLSVSDMTAQSSLANIDSAVTGTLSVSDMTAQSSLANIDSAVTGTLSVSDLTAQSSLANIDSAVTGTLSVSDLTAQSSLANIDSAVTGTLSVSDMMANTSLSNIDGKLSSGSDLTLSSAQQVLCYGRDNGGTLDALRTDAGGHLEVVVDDFVKGQALMNDSLPVVIASDQSDLPVVLDSVNNRGTHGNIENNLASLAFGTNTSSIYIGKMNKCSIFYQDSYTPSSDGLKIYGSADGINYYELGDLYPFVEGSVRIAAWTELYVGGLLHLRLKNTSLADDYTDVTATVVGTA